ncbi:hypothetical protein NDU88_003117 [Pleurodeles waltl]|uniref:Uncharacterized protein n=1 Tax=Pleurodeles waltl TaxID=8319 RepID=A0AAV7T3V2_PLEWA|nr:hypothetical protein NDU88_003117 [Pleurodeles waltl]
MAAPRPAGTPGVPRRRKRKSRVSGIQISGFPQKRKGWERHAKGGKKERKSTETRNEWKTPARMFRRSETGSQTTSADYTLERTPTKGKEVRTAETPPRPWRGVAQAASVFLFCLEFPTTYLEMKLLRELFNYQGGNFYKCILFIFGLLI